VLLAGRSRTARGLRSTQRYRGREKSFDNGAEFPGGAADGFTVLFWPVAAGVEVPDEEPEAADSGITIT
jgi:hypothetical protein